MNVQLCLHQSKQAFRCGKRKVNIHYNIIKVIKVTVDLNHINKLKHYCKPAAMTGAVL